MYPLSYTPPVVFSPVPIRVGTVPSTLDQYYANLREFCTVEGPGHSDDVGGASRPYVLWVRSHASSSGRLENIFRLELHI